MKDTWGLSDSEYVRWHRGYEVVWHRIRYVGNKGTNAVCGTYLSDQPRRTSFVGKRCKRCEKMSKR